MEENISQEVQIKDVAKHYFSSVVIYGVILGLISAFPVYADTIGESSFNFITFFALYYLLYIIIAPIIFFTVKPKSVLNSKSVTVLNYIRRQFLKPASTEEFINSITPTETEQQAFMAFFVKAFFGVGCMMILCGKYLPSLDYNIDFLKVMFSQAMHISGSGSIQGGIVQYILDTGDMWITIMFTITTAVLAFSYLTELDILKNKIKYTDTTPLGILSCAICYYPLIILTDKFISMTPESNLPVENQTLLVILTISAMIANFVVMISTLRLGTKSGNLTNRGIVTGFPYNIVRHPSYSAQIFYIIVTSIPLFILETISLNDKIYVALCLFVWVYIYYLRAITEERNLIKDEKYKEYVEKVRYRFIPKLF